MWKLQRWGLLATLVAVAMLLVIDGAQSKRHAQQPQQSAKSQPQLQQPQQAPASDQHGTEQSPLSVKVIPAPKSEEEAARERQEREEKAELDQKLVKFNGDLAHYTLVLAIVAMLQFLALFVQAVFLRLAFKATKKSADIAEASLVTLERASVFMPDINTNWHPDTSRPGKFWWHFRPIWQNSGSTQTKDMITNVACDFRDTPLPQDFDCPPNAESYPAIIPQAVSSDAAAAKKMGVYKGRKKTIKPEKVQALKAEGLGITEIANQLKISRQSVYRALS